MKARQERLEYLRSQIRAEQISMSELAELQGLADQIEPGDVELLEWAGVPEFPDEADVVIDWEAKFHQKVSDNIRNKAVSGAKLAETQLELVLAREQIAALNREVTRLKPSGDKLAGVIADLESANGHIVALNSRIRELTDQRRSGQRVVMEDVITWLQREVRRMPVAKPIEVDGA